VEFLGVDASWAAGRDETFPISLAQPWSLNQLPSLSPL